MTGGAYAASAGQPLLLTDSPTLGDVLIFGGTAVVSQTAEDQIARAVNGVEK